VRLLKAARGREPSTKDVSTIGLGLAKNVFQVHGVDALGRVVLCRKLRRGQVKPFFARLSPCLVGMEACASSHHWARELMGLGHEVRLIAPADIKAYVRRQKNDAADAEAICEAVSRPRTRFVAVKSAEAQSVLVLHRGRHLLVGQRTMLVNALRGHLAEFGVIAPQGLAGIAALVEIVSDERDERVPRLARRALAMLVRQIEELTREIKVLEAEILAWHRSSETSLRLETIPGVGFVTASALAASIADAGTFRSVRQFAAFLGLVPRQTSSGGKERLGRISKMGDAYIRHLLVVGATATVRASRGKTSELALWIARLLAKKPVRLVTVALANKMARIAFAVMAKGEVYRPQAARA
jgi:transposase